MGSITNLTNGNILKLSILFLVVGSILMLLMTSIRKMFTKNKKRAILYVLFILLTFALTGLLSSSKVLNDTPLNSFFGFQFIFLLLGILHIYIMRKYFEDLSKKKSDYFSEFLFTIAFACIGLFAFFNVVGYFRPLLSFTFLAAGFCFIIPIMVYKFYEFATLIPIPVYKKWLYPLNENIKDPTSKELENPLVISFEFQKKEELSDITNFRVKAPEAMEFGKLFYFFINDYNERHPESKIAFLDANSQQPQGWIFYVKPKWWSGIRHINFAKTIAGNNIREDNVIVCQRIID
ncbi:TssN family type VI secretion system protein [Cochleicola gelatinilyticus]|uniref:TssN family type VI secretion system protein n=1 Tax=Cochleicola gelatinilyticus TaxID=1763537 RepID=A0A167HLR1_9FLAO|nr:TssN family type VI secretion system protein [Cochleicola gelatinilyticus]OAB78746.1 hypothetical protein ULVI_09190 [Cochleicola gelatinilyticus]